MQIILKQTLANCIYELGLGNPATLTIDIDLHHHLQEYTWDTILDAEEYLPVHYVECASQKFPAGTVEWVFTHCRIYPLLRVKKFNCYLVHEILLKRIVRTLYIVTSYLQVHVTTSRVTFLVVMVWWSWSSSAANSGTTSMVLHPVNDSPMRSVDLTFNFPRRVW